VERLARTQAACLERTRDGLQAVLGHLEASLAALGGPGSAEQAGAASDTQAVLDALKAAVGAVRAPKKVSAATREFHDAVKGFGKVVDSMSEADICAAARKEQLPAAALNKVCVCELTSRAPCRCSR